MNEPEEDKTGEKPLTEQFLREARRIWRRDPDKERSERSEDLDFRPHFGCCPLVASSLWNLLQTTEYTPEGGKTEHLLWTLMFIKIYGKQKQMCSLAGGVDHDTFRKWTWLFLRAIELLEPHVVSNYVVEMSMLLTMLTPLSLS